MTDDEITTIQHIFDRQEVPNIEIQGRDVDNGWTNGTIAQRAVMRQARGSKLDPITVEFRVFDSALPPPSGYFALPAAVQERRSAFNKRVAGTIESATQEERSRGSPRLKARTPGPAKPPRAAPAPASGSTDPFVEFSSAPVVEDGVVTLNPGALVMVRMTRDYVRENSEAGFQYAIAKFIGEDLENEGEEEEGEAREMEEGETPRWLAVQWYGNNRAQATHTYAASSVYHPGWVDMGDPNQPLMFEEKAPDSRRASNVVGPVVPYQGLIEASAVAYHGFVLSPDHKLPGSLAHALGVRWASRR